jgi:hypothetical protein
MMSNTDLTKTGGNTGKVVPAWNDVADITTWSSKHEDI